MVSKEVSGIAFEVTRGLSDLLQALRRSNGPQKQKSPAANCRAFSMWRSERASHEALEAA